MIENLQNYINILSPILSAIGGILVTLTLVANKFRKLKNTFGSSIQKEIESNRNNRVRLDRMERRLAEMDRKLDHLVDKNRRPL